MPRHYVATGLVRFHGGDHAAMRPASSANAVASSGETFHHQVTSWLSLKAAFRSPFTRTLGLETCWTFDAGMYV